MPNIVYDVTGQTGERHEFKGHYQGYAVSIGSHYTVGVVQQIGNMKLGKNGWSITGFTANMFKHIINFYFFMQITSGYHMFQYTLDEFFRTPNGRNPFFGWTSRVGMFVVSSFAYRYGNHLDFTRATLVVVLV